MVLSRMGVGLIAYVISGSRYKTRAVNRVVKLVSTFLVHCSHVTVSQVLVPSDLFY